jgi:Ni/Co efflux regulator RcnB
LRIDVNPDANPSRRSAMKRLLLAAAGLSVIAGPMAAAAQSQPDGRGNHQDHQNARQMPANRPENRPAPQTFHAPQQNVQRLQPAPNRGPSYGNPSAHTTWRGAGPNGAPIRAQPNGPSQYRRYGNTGQAQTYRGGQYQSRNGYQNFRSWNGGNVRLRGDWWRGRSSFNGYSGRREGYWFAPGWGYYSVDPRWLDFDWVVGSVVPYELQSYAISDPYEYGLPPEPYGCEWIFLRDQIVLIDLGSGQILEIAGGY